MGLLKVKHENLKIGTIVKPKRRKLTPTPRPIVAAVITTPDRQMYLGPLLERLTPLCQEVRIFNDVHKWGHRYNYGRALKVMCREWHQEEGLDVQFTAGKHMPILVCTDDMITVPDWLQRWQAIHEEAERSIYCLFSRKRSVFTPENIARGYHVGTPARGFYDAATIFINQPYLPWQADDWFEREGRHKMTAQRAKHWDVILQEYLIDQGKEWVTCTPSLFEHVGKISTMQHKIGGATVYVGNTL